MEESGVYDNSDTNQNQPTTTESGPDIAAHSGADVGHNKPNPINNSPTLGRTIAGRDVHGEGVTDQGTGEPGEEAHTGEATEPGSE